MQRKEYEDLSFLNHLVKILWKWKWMILIGVTITTLSALTVTMILPKTYISNSVLSISELNKIPTVSTSNNAPTGMSLPVFNSYLDILAKRKLFKQFLNYNQKLELGKKRFPNFKKNIKPLLAYETEKFRNRVKRNFVVKVRITGKGSSAESARKQTEWLGSFFQTALLNIRIHRNFKNQEINLTNTIINEKVKIDKIKNRIMQLRQKESFLTNQILKLPGISGKRDQTLLNVSSNTEKYLSPHRQVIACKIAIKDNEISIQNLNHNIKTIQTTLDFCKSVSKYLKKDDGYLVNKNLLSQLVKELEAFFEDKHSTEEMHAYYQLKLKLTRFERIRDMVYTFISRAKLPKKAARPRGLMIIVISFVLACCFFVFLANAMEWWLRNKESIIS